jgi:hypothetical protein
MATRKILWVAISKTHIGFFSWYFNSHFYTKTLNHSSARKNGEFALPLLSVVFFYVYFTNAVNLKILCACSNNHTVFQAENKQQAMNHQRVAISTTTKRFKFLLGTLKMAMLLLQFGVLSAKNLQLRDRW